MIRSILLVLVLVVVVGGSYFMFFSGKGDDAPQTAGKLTAPQGQPVADGKKGAPAPAASGGEDVWAQRCSKEGDKHCEVFQRLVVEETKQRLVEFAVGYPSELKGEAQAVVLLPLGVLVSEGLILTVDGKSPARAVFRTCGPDGCIVAVNLPKEFLALMNTGKVLGVSFIDGGTGKQLNVGLSLTGFAAKLKKIQS